MTVDGYISVLSFFRDCALKKEEALNKRDLLPNTIRTPPKVELGALPYALCRFGLNLPIPNAIRVFNLFPTADHGPGVG